LTTVAEKLSSWDGFKAELKSHLGIANGAAVDEIVLKAMFQAAVKRADRYLERDFVINRARWVIGPAVEAGYQYTLKVTPEDESAYTQFSASYTATSGNSAQRVAYELRKALDLALASRDVTVSGAGAAIEVVCNNPNVAMEASYTKSGTNATVTETLWFNDVPTDVVMGVKEFVKALWAVRRRAPGVTAIKTAALGENYESGPAAEVAFQAARIWWSDYKAHPLFDGGRSA
jgi:hypothetical protein